MARGKIDWLNNTGPNARLIRWLNEQGFCFDRFSSHGEIVATNDNVRVVIDRHTGVTIRALDGEARHGRHLVRWEVECPPEVPALVALATVRAGWRQRWGKIGS